ncbi:unnamed protein product [Adineta steineri]|uniref:Uncharacterized protein n=1 Tax=Adineta steineri TaxID=433720 RepID=A0A814S717_9BILA|nr:unnamed protein product [Adineta steineri]CAF3674978.1 unnamed protein product [Adineta steineri]
MSVNLVNCFADESTVELCATKVCVISHVDGDNEYEQKCGVEEEAERIRLQMTTYVDLYDNKLERETILICPHSECNSKSAFSAILAALEKHYDLNPMFIALNMEQKPKETTTVSTGTTKQARTTITAGTTKQTTTTVPTGTTKQTTTTVSTGTTTRLTTTVSSGTTKQPSTTVLAGTTKQPATTSTTTKQPTPTSTTTKQPTTTSTTSSKTTTPTNGMPAVYTISIMCLVFSVCFFLFLL